MDDMKRLEIPLSDDSEESISLLRKDLMYAVGKIRNAQMRMEELAEGIPERQKLEIDIRDKMLKWQTVANAVALFVLGALTMYFWSAKYTPTMEMKRAHEAEVVQARKDVAAANEQVTKAKTIIVGNLSEVMKQMSAKMKPNDYNRIIQRNKRKLDEVESFMKE